MKFRTIVPTLILIMVVAAFAAPANAQITITGPSNGFCTGQPGLTQEAHPFNYVLYGAGQNSDPDCGSANTGANPGTISEQDILAQPGIGFDIVGAGALKGLLVRAGSGFGGGITIHVWVVHPDPLSPPTLAITCSAAANLPGQPVPDCTDSTTSASVADKDKVVIIALGNQGDTYKNIHWYLGKQ